MHSVIIALIVSGGAAAVSLQSSIDAHPLSRLLARQGGSGGIDPSTIPPQCQSPCGPIIADLQRCSANSCICTNNVRDDFAACMNCFITSSNGNQQIVSAAEGAATQYETACKTSGMPVSSITFSSAGGAGVSTPSVGSTSIGPAQPIGTAGAGPISITSAGSPASTTASPSKGKSAAARGAPLHVGLSFVAMMALCASALVV